MFIHKIENYFPYENWIPRTPLVIDFGNDGRVSCTSRICIMKEGKSWRRKNINGIADVVEEIPLCVVSGQSKYTIFAFSRTRSCYRYTWHFCGAYRILVSGDQIIYN